MSRQYTLLATLLLFATQGAASDEDSFLDRSFQMTNAESGYLSDVERSNHWTIRGQCDSCDDGCCASCDAGRCRTWVGGSELVFLRPHASEPYDSSSGELQAGSRWTLGRMNNSGQTWRVRYFEFQYDDFDSGSLQQEPIDAEYAGRFELGCNWRGEIAAGLRHAQYSEIAFRDKDDNSEYDATIGQSFRLKFATKCYATSMPSPCAALHNNSDRISMVGVLLELRKSKLGRKSPAASPETICLFVDSSKPRSGRASGTTTQRMWD